MTTMTDISKELAIVFYKLRDGEIDAKIACEMNNTAGKIIGAAKVQIAYAALRGEKPEIPFLMEVATPAAIEAAPAAKALPTANSAFPDAMMKALVKGGK